MALAYTPTTWAEQLLSDVNTEAPNAPKVPIDTNTVDDILHWMPAEEPVSSWYNRNNPLNASLGTSASDGTGSYPDLATGAQYTAAMIDQRNMSGIRAALAADDPAGGGFSQAVVASPWASSHYGGDPLHIAKTTSSPNAPGPAGGGGAGTANLASAQLASLNANPFDLFGIPQTAASSIWGAVGPFLAKSVLVIGGIGLLIVGISKTTGAGKGLGKVIEVAPEAAAA